METLAGLAAQVTCPYHLLQDVSRAVLGIAELLVLLFTHSKNYVQTDQIGQSQRADGWLQPSIIALSISSALATPSW